MSAVEEAVKRQLALQKKRNTGPQEDEEGFIEQSPEEDHAQALRDEATPATEEGPLTKLGQGEQPIRQIKHHPDPYVQKGLRILGELDLQNADHESTINKLMAKEGGIQHPNDQKEFEHRSTEMEHNKRARAHLLRTIDGLSKAYYGEEEKPPEAEQPGVGSKIWEGIKTLGKGALDTAKYAGSHPIEAMKDVGRGAERFATLPARFAAEALPKGVSEVGGDFSLKSLTNKFHGGREAELAQSHKEAGVEPGETGPAVMGAVGESLLPVGPTLKAGQALKNVVKGAGFAGGAYAGEQVAKGEPVTGEGIGGSAVVGGAMGGVLGKLMGRHAADAGGGGGVYHGEVVPPGAGPDSPLGLTNQQKMLEAGPTTMEGKGGTIHQPGPPKEIAGPSAHEPEVPEGSVELPLSGYLSEKGKFVKVWKTPKGDLIGELKSGEIIRADQQPTSPSLPPEGGHERSTLERLVSARKLQQGYTGQPGTEPPKPSGQGAVPEQPFAGAPKPATTTPTPVAASVPQGAQAPSPLQQLVRPQPQAPPSVAPTAPTVVPPGAQPQIKPTIQAQPAPQSTPQQPPQVAAQARPPVRAVNPQPQAQQNASVLQQLMAQKQAQAPQPQPAAQPTTPAPAQPSMLKQVLGRNEPNVAPGSEERLKAKVKENTPEIGAKPARAEGRSEPKVVIEPKNTSVKSGISAPSTKPAAGIDFVKWAKNEGFGVKEDGPIVKIHADKDPRSELITEFDTRIPGSRKKSIEEMKIFHEGTVKLYSGVDVGEAWKGMKRLGQYLKKEKSYLFGEGHGESLSPIHGLKTGAAIERGGGTGGRVITEGNETERAAHKVVEDLRYKIQPDGSYHPSKFEAGLNLPKEERLPAEHSVLDFEKINMRPGDDASGSPYKAQYDKLMAEYKKLTPAQKSAIHGTQELSEDIEKYRNAELRERVLVSKGRKTGLVTPKEMKDFIAGLPEDERMALSSIDIGVSGVGYKRMYYPHRFEGNFELHEIDPGTGVATGKKFLRPTEGARPGEESSTVNTMRQARKFKDQIAAKEGISPDRLKIVMPKQAGGSKYLEGRKGAIGYEQHDVFQNYLDYAHEVAHWVEMSKLGRVVGDLVGSSKLSEADKSFIMNRWLPRVAGKQSTQDMFLNNLVKRVPGLKDALDPYVPATQLMQGARQFTTATALGVFNAASALVNADGVARHVWPALARLSNELKLPAFSAEKYGANAIKAWTSSTTATALDKLHSFDRSKAFAIQLGEALKLNPANKNLLQKMAHEGVLDIQIFGERLPPAEKNAQKAMRGMLALFATTEDFSRGVASVAAYRMARDAGLSEAQALQKAFQLTSSALGRYSKAGKPMVYSSELGGTLGIFKTYLHVMMDNAYLNMRHPVKDFGAFSRYALAAIGISGLTGLYPGTQDIDELATKAFGTSPQAWLHKNLPLWVVDGIPTLFGTDLSSRAGAPEVVPNKGEDWLGAVYSKVAKPIGSLAQAAYQNMLRGAQGEPTSFLQDILPSLKQAAPNTVGLRYLLSESEDALKGSRERTVIKNLTPEEKALKVLGLPLNREVQSRQQYQVGENLKEKWGEERKRLVDLFIKGDKSTTEDWSRLSHKYGITPRMVHEERKRKQQTLGEREKRSMPKPLRRSYEFEEPEF